MNRQSNPVRKEDKPIQAMPQRLIPKLLCVLTCSAIATTAVVVAYAGDTNLISVDFVTPRTGGAVPASGDTSPTSTTVPNADGLIFTGQSGAWNAFNIDPSNQGNLTDNAVGPSAPLTNGAGGVTTVTFAITSKYRCSTGTTTLVGYLRNESARLYPSLGTPNPVTWRITGLAPNSSYQLAFFMGTQAGTNTANGVDGVRDSEGDANWTNVVADGTGTINGALGGTSTANLPMYGFQLKRLYPSQPPQLAPSAPSPANGASNVPTSTSLGWATCPGAESYDVYFWLTSGTRPLLPTATVTVNQYVPPPYLAPFTSYSWQVVASNYAGSTNGPVWSFTTDDGRPVVPTTPSPTNGAANVIVDTVLDWAASTLANGYQVYLWPSGSSQPATPTATVAASTYQPSSVLTGSTAYDWQIVATNSYGSTTGAVWTFTTGDPYPGYLVPWPASVTMRSGNFPVTASTRIVAADASLLRLAWVMTNDFYMAAGLRLTALQGTPQAGDIVLTNNPSLSGEAYTLDVNSSNIVLAGSNYQAVAWASVTLLQALNTSNSPVTVPQMLISDQPASPLRTVTWDIARFYHPLETLYELVDLHRMYKVTYMNLMMSAEGLFTFGTTAYPSIATPNDSSVPYKGSPGFYLPTSSSRLYYTKAELTNLVQYAKDRGIIIVPLLETPAHAGSMTSRDPSDFCSVGGTTQTTDININYSNAITAMGAIMGELADVFNDSPYVHIAVDEVSSSEFTGFPYWSTSAALYNWASGGDALTWYMWKLSNFASNRLQTTWAWNAPGAVGKGYDVPTSMVYTAWGTDDGPTASGKGYWVMRAAGGHVAGMFQASVSPPYNRCLLYRPAEGIYNRLLPLWRYISDPDADYTDLSPANDWVPLTGRENKIIGAHIMEFETPYEAEVPAMRLSMPALGEPTWNQNTNLPRLNWDNFLVRQTHSDQLYQRVMRPVVLSVTTQVDPKDICFVAGGMVTMTSAVPGTIRYTVGTDYNNSWYNFPSNTSTAYTAPFAISQSSVISARLFDSNGNPLGNPVTKGFYLITPVTHYKYYYTGDPAPADFESGTPIVSSVMGQMNGDAPQEDVRRGDTLHRTVYTGSLTASSGAYTFASAFGGGAIYIDRVLAPDGVATTLTAGEHLVKIVTPASGTGTPYTFAGPGHGSATDINVLLKTLATASQVFPASCTFGTQGTADGASALQLVTIINHNVFSNMVVSSVQLTGANPGEFVISQDTGQAVLAPGYERVVGVRFDPSTAGAKSAALHVVASGLTGGYADVALTGTAVWTLSAVPEFPASGFSQPGGVPTFDIPDTVPTSQYTLTYKNNLTDPVWTPLSGSGTAPGNGGTLRLSDPTVVGSLPTHRFYRLQRNP